MASGVTAASSARGSYVEWSDQPDKRCWVGGRQIASRHIAGYCARVPRAWYFAYGSNMQTATFRGRRGIEFRRALPARVPGWRLVLDQPPLLPIGEGFASEYGSSRVAARRVGGVSRV